MTLQAPDLADGRPEGADAGAGPHLGRPLRRLDDEVGDAVAGQVGRHHGAVGPGKAGGRGDRAREVGQTAGRDHEHLPVAGPPCHQVGVRRRGDVGLELPAGPPTLRLGREATDVRQPGVEVLARTCGGRRVAVAVDRLEGLLADLLAGGGGVDAVQRELPGEERAVRLDHRARRLLDVVVADRRHRERVVVVVQGVRADHRAVDAAVPALPDPPEPVDEVVVADVRPAAALGVVRVDAAQDARHLVARVVVGVHRVVDEAGVHLAVVQRARAAHALVGAPLGTRVDLRLRGEGRSLQGDLVGAVVAGARLGGEGAAGVRGAARRRRGRGCAGLRAVGVQRGPLDGGLGGGAGVDDRELQVGRQVAGRRLDLDLDVVDVADQQGVGAGTRVPRLRGARVGSVVVVVLEVHPARPGVTRPGADLQRDLVLGDLGAVLPGDADGAVPLDRLGDAGDRVVGRVLGREHVRLGAGAPRRRRRTPSGRTR